MSKAKTDFVAKARAAWGKTIPDWVEVLAIEANRTDASKAAKRIGYSGAVLSGLFANKYPGDLDRVEAKVRGVLMSAVVICPVVGEIGLDRCRDEQKTGNTGASPLRSQFFRKCRGIGTPKCPHSRLQTEASDG
jgi:hypothetical protein